MVSVLNEKTKRQNRQLMSMLLPIQEKLKQYTPEDICRRGGLTYDAARGEFSFPSLGEEIRIRYPDFVCNRELEMWHYLTLLQYMDTADGVPLGGDLISLEQMPGGRARGVGFNKDLALMMERGLKEEVTKEQVLQAAARMGGRELPSKADITLVFVYAPRFPVTLNLYLADDEFPASGKLLVDDRAHHYLGIEAAGGACSSVVQRLVKLVQEESK